MKNSVCDTCPGCKRRCPSCRPCCKYGKKYFSACYAKTENKKTTKWQQKLDQEGWVYLLLKTGKGIKKQLKKNKTTEKEILSRLTPSDSALLYEILKKLSNSTDSEK